MHRGRNRSRKPVEVNLSTNSSPPLSISTKPMNYPSPFLYPQLSSSRPPGNVVSSQDRFWLESRRYSSHSEKDNSYGMKEETEEHPFLSENCGRGTNMTDSWNLEPLAMNTTSSSSSSLMVQSKQRDYHDYDNLGLKIERKDEPKKVMHHFFDESPHNDNDDHNKDSSTTQLSMSIPTGALAHDFFRTHNDK
ncbi:hypothetical protein L2E82_12825 [Cichorium intybus]|uniref:Uncharacterized protein n=1 Tax=Cichorium intybus TaxID=13427 RepID=A0ACB9GGK9_CICIN|nr:hypothetical protein L2E82_12825 [Cichorium intybus]